MDFIFVAKVLLIFICLLTSIVIWVVLAFVSQLKGELDTLETQATSIYRQLLIEGGRRDYRQQIMTELAKKIFLNPDNLMKLIGLIFTFTPGLGDKLYHRGFVLLRRFVG